MIGRHSRRSRQQGAILIIGIIMLMVLTLFAVAAMNLANINLQIVGNFQWQRQNEILTETAIEQLLSDGNNFSTTTTARVVCSNSTIAIAGGCPSGTTEVGTINAPLCSSYRAAEGYTKKLGELVPEDSDWIIRASVNDSGTSGATVTIVRGISARMLAGNCPE